MRKTTSSLFNRDTAADLYMGHSSARGRWVSWFERIMSAYRNATLTQWARRDADPEIQLARIEAEIEAAEMQPDRRP